MKRILRRGAVLACLAGVLALTGSALADTTVSGQAGPVPIPKVPVNVCVQQGDVGVNECVTTPPAQDVQLNVVVHVPTPAAAVNVVPPTVTETQCPAGTEGVALKVNTGSATVATIGGNATVTVVVNGQPTQQVIPIPTTTVNTPNQTVTVFACAGASPGL